MQNQGLRLIPPTADLADGYQSLVAEFQEAGEPPVPWVLGLEAESLKALVAALQAYSEGIGIPEGFVPHSTFWLVHSDQTLLGVSNLRHSLTPRLLRKGGHIGFGIRPSSRRQGLATRLLALTLQEARLRGIDRALLTCDKQNIASAKVIRKNGGVLDTEETEPDGNFVQRYWIELGI